MKLISDPKVNYKIKKNLKKGYYTYSLALAHSDISGYNVCPMANRIQMGEDSTKKSTCSSVCVGYNGFAQRFPKVMGLEYVRQSYSTRTDQNSWTYYPRRYPKVSYEPRN